MQTRATQIVPEGIPIIPDGVVALTEDIGCFQRAVQDMGYSVEFGQARARTVPDPKDRRVELTARCRIGELTDEFLHVWNNFNERRGNFLPVEDAREHRAVSRQMRFSGSSNDRRFHQFELENYTRHLRASNAHIPLFIRRTFIDLSRER